MDDFLDNKNMLGFSDVLQGDAEFIPVLSNEDEEMIEKEELPEVLPILPLRNAVLFPGIVTPITVGREKSLILIKEVNKGNKILGCVAQKDVSVEEPGLDDLYKIGTVARIIKMLNMPDGSTTVIIQGRRRFQLDEIVTMEPYHIGKVSSRPNAQNPADEKNFEALVSALKDLALQVIKKSPAIPSDASFAIKNIESNNYLVNFICSNLNADVVEKQFALEYDEMQDRAEYILKSLSKELQVLDLKNKIQKKVKVDLDKQQREYLLHQQLKTIREELGDASSNDEELDELKIRASKKKWSKEVQEVFNKEHKKLQRMNPSAMEYSMQMNYLDVLVDLPWGEYTKDKFDLDKAQSILDREHYGLKEVKERIIEYLAVLKLKGDMKSPIICLVGPPGVGKTSLGKSVAEALGRKYVRMSLGGMRDESEIRGHRKTYIGALPGRIIQNLKKVKSSNPVFVLDEIDKVGGSSVNGDPASALLEVLDPEQNTTFHDNFLEVEYDLSNVMFIATANTMSTIHPALRDRMEVIDVSGYLLEEKYQIAKQHLIPKQIKNHGMKKSQLSFRKEIIEKIISDYTRESGVRSLDKVIAKVIRNRARFVAMEREYNKRISAEDLKDILGYPKYRNEKSIKNDIAGVVTGLAWTSVGGVILFIEVSLSKGKGSLTLTGNLGDVMKESATIAYEYLKSNSDALGIDSEVFSKWNVHIHVPEGATPKDGPSAGITLFTALASAFTQRKVKARIAMTGEITLRGKVTPVGGIKEKILAAKRANINNIILCEDNRRDIEEIDQEYIKGVNFYYIENMIEVIPLALLDEKVDNPKKI